MHCPTKVGTLTLVYNVTPEHKGLFREMALMKTTNEEDSVSAEETEVLHTQGWDDHGLFKDDPEALQLFDEIEEERNRHLVGTE